MSPVRVFALALCAALLAQPIVKGQGQAAGPAQAPAQNEAQGQGQPSGQGAGPGQGRGGGARGRGGQPAPPEPPGFTRIKVTSSIDKSEQDAIIVVPSSGPSTEARPLVVFLHAWSVDWTQRQPEVEAEADRRNWLLLIPNFRGAYNNPQSCGAPMAQQDILDAIEWVKVHHKVDDKRIYALGLSGGGFMTMLMAGRYPQMWAAVSEYAGITDLASWYKDEHPQDRYADNMRACLGGAPDATPQIAAEYKARAPLSYFKPGFGVPIDLNAGRNDRTVLPRHSMRAFEQLAPGTLTAEDRALLQTDVPLPTMPLRVDPLTGRRVYVRREVGNVRFTLFEGGHEWFPKASFAWLEQFSRP